MVTGTVLHLPSTPSEFVCSLGLLARKRGPFISPGFGVSPCFVFPGSVVAGTSAILQMQHVWAFCSHSLFKRLIQLRLLQESPSATKMCIRYLAVRLKHLSCFVPANNLRLSIGPALCRVCCWTGILPNISSWKALNFSSVWCPGTDPHPLDFLSC